MADKVIPVKVALRIRPLNKKELNEACEECLRTIPNENQMILGKNKAFTYDYVFCKKSPQVEIYETCISSLLGALFKGYNATVLAYGQTGSGKTHTMGTGYSSLCNANQKSSENGFMSGKDFDEVGVVPRVLNDLFRTIDEEKQKDSNSKFIVKVSFVEVYNEEIKDLFVSTGQSEPLNIREENNSIRVVGLSETEVPDAISTIQMLEKGSSNRMTGGTAMNEQSSRSHAIFTITLEQLKGEENDLIKSKFHLVDLAGSERQSKTKAEGIRLKEGININLGLLALGNVISVLGEENVKHVPYRESKLTRLLQDSLGGNSHTLMVACVSPADSNMEETLNSLRYADRARKIKNKPIINIDPQLAELNGLKEQVQFLKSQILQLTGGCGLMPEFNPDAAASSKDNDDKLKEENEKLKKENSKILNEFQRLININRHTYERMTQLESEKEEQKRKFDEIKQAFEKISKESEEQTLQGPLNADETDISNSTSVSDHPMNQTKSLISDLQTKLGEFEKLQEKEVPSDVKPEEDLSQKNENSGNDAAGEADKEFTLRQAQMQFQLTEYDSDLQRKQSLHNKMMDDLTRTHMHSYGNIDELKSRIGHLEKEKEDLQCVVSSSDHKMNQQKKERLKKLELEVQDLRRKEKEHVRLVKLKEENEKQCEKLKNEILKIKSDRIKLIKQMKTDNDSFRRYKTEKERELTQLKAQERKRLVEISKLQTGNTRQEAILKRKNEEINRIQKQLRDTSAKQKLVAAQRQQTFDRKDSSQLADKLRSWITHELELSVGLAEARINLTKLIDERKESNADLITLNEKLVRLNDVSNGNTNYGNSLLPPPVKQRKQQELSILDSTYIASTCDEEDSEEVKKKRVQLEKRIERIKEEIEIKNVQINELQQMVIEGDQDEKAKHLFNNIHGLLEAKVVLKHLYSTGIQYLLDSKLKQSSFETTNNALTQDLKESKKKTENIDEEFKSYKQKENDSKNEMERHYEYRILLLIKNGINYPELEVDERFGLLMETIKNLEKRMTKDGKDVKPENHHHHSNIRRSYIKQGQEASILGHKDEFKRAQRAKRDHRRTRVIRTEDVKPFSDRSNTLMAEDAIMEQNSPQKSPSMLGDVPPTPDDKKDPNWVNPWARTPLKTKTRPNTSGYLRKGNRRTSTRTSKTRLLAPPAEVNNVSSNYENENE